MPQRIPAVVFFLLGASLLLWLAYDATAVQSALGLRGVVEEATVAVAGLVIAAASLVAGLICWRWARNSPAA